MPESLKRVQRADDRENTRNDRDDDEIPSFWASWLGVRFGARGRHIVHLAYVTVLAAVICAMIWLHDQNTRDRTTRTQQLSATLIDLVEHSNKNQRFMACISSRPESERRAEFDTPTSFCNRLAQ